MWCRTGSLEFILGRPHLDLLCLLLGATIYDKAQLEKFPVSEIHDIGNYLTWGMTEGNWDKKSILIFLKREQSKHDSGFLIMVGWPKGIMIFLAGFREHN